MAWNTILVEQLRYLIFDLDPADYTWTDLQLEKFLAIATIQVTSDLQGWNTYINGPYTVTTEASGSAMISPDPVSNTSSSFSNLIVLKAACVLARSELRKLGKTGGWKIVDDKSTIDGTKAVDNAYKVATDYCTMYADALDDFKQGNIFNAGIVGKGVLSPYQSPNGTPFGYYGYRQHNPGDYR